VKPSQAIVLRQWLLLLVLLAGGIVMAVRTELLWRPDHSLYDTALPRLAVPEDVVIVAIDDASIERIGRWPWRRALHGALLERLTMAGAKAIALDIVFTEPDADRPDDDGILADALRHAPPTVLPLIVQWPRAGEPLRELRPVVPIAAAAAALGHAHLEIDRDGIARSVFLREGFGPEEHSHLAAALLAAAGDPAARDLPGTRAPAAAGSPPGAWRRDHQVHLPFAGPPGTITRLSYADVVTGRVPAEALRDKYVFVGLTAQGLGDAYATPRSGQGVAMPGVEISANVLGMLREGTSIRFAPPAMTTAIALLALCVAFLCFLRLTPRYALLCTFGLALALVAASLLSLRVAGYWMPPSVAVAALVLAYPLWSWRRLEATQQYLDREFAVFDEEDGKPVPETAARRRIPLLGVGDVLQARIDRAQAATTRLRHLRRILADTIGAVPDAILLVDAGGRIVLGNPIAATLFGVAAPSALVGLPVDSLLRTMGTTTLPAWRELAARAPLSLELMTADRQDLMLRITSFSDGSGTRSGSVVDIADVTALKRVQRERDDTIHFLSHDLRSPSSSLLGLASMLRDPRRTPPLPEVARQIEGLAGRTLSLADGFIALARAQTIEDDRFVALDLKDALQDAIDDVWAAAQARSVRILDLTAIDTAPARGDRQMLGRCLANLLGNAVKFSPEGATVDVRIERRGDCWAVTVQDIGPGIAPERQGALFQRFSRGLHAADSDPGGVGLGLAFVQVVAQKHAGAISVESSAGSGASFTLSVPVEDRSAAIYPA
jgi:CHASE2 domain-containing sensor protein/signal transduction histidine kinase